MSEDGSPRKLLAKHRARGAVIDTNLLLLLIIGTYDIKSVGEKRTRQYTAADYDLINHIVRILDKIIVTPNIMTEVDNLARWLPDTARLASVVREVWKKFAELYKPTEAAISSAEYGRLGLTDTHILGLASERYLIITDDLPLYHWLETRRHDAININHIRTLAPLRR